MYVTRIELGRRAYGRVHNFDGKLFWADGHGSARILCREDERTVGQDLHDVVVLGRAAQCWCRVGPLSC